MARQCGGCGIPLLGKHAGKAPERLVAIVGGPDSGKTSYLLMVVHGLIHGHGQTAVPISGHIDDAAQEEAFHHEWQQLASGLPVAKTAAVAQTCLLYVTMGRTKCQLFLYDAPGEEFTTISQMTRQQYFPLLEGFILLVDPLCFSPTPSTTESNGAVAALQDVVAATVAAAASGMAAGQGGKLPLRVAVVLSKADFGLVKDTVGDIRQGDIPGKTCRQAMVRWGGENALRALEQRFAAVEYFACSQLGRAVEAGNRQPFQGSGVLEPLVWLLTGHRNDLSKNRKHAG
jgi:hypothetical protein